MAAKKSLSFAESAISDLEEVLAWYAEQGSEKAGRRLIEKVLSQTERLALYPESGRIVPEFGMKHLLEIIQPPFRIVYRCDKEQIIIVRVWRSERLMKLP